MNEMKWALNPHPNQRTYFVQIVSSAGNLIPTKGVKDSHYKFRPKLFNERMHHTRRWSTELVTEDRKVRRFAKQMNVHSKTKNRTGKRKSAHCYDRIRVIIIIRIVLKWPPAFHVFCFDDRTSQITFIEHFQIARFWSFCRIWNPGDWNYDITWSKRRQSSWEANSSLENFSNENMRIKCLHAYLGLLRTRWS